MTRVWATQTVMNFGMYLGHLLLAFAILASGNNFYNFYFFAKILNLEYFSKQTFSRKQSNILIPRINSFWEGHLQSPTESIKKERLLFCWLSEAIANCSNKVHNIK